MSERDHPKPGKWGDWEALLRSEECPQPLVGPLWWEEGREDYHVNVKVGTVVRIREEGNHDAMVQSDLWQKLENTQ